MSLEDRVAIVTGGERGIGKGIVKRLLKEGMRVCIAGIDTTAADNTLPELGAGDRVRFFRTDVGCEPEVRAMVEDCLTAFGRLDACIANAAIADAGSKPIEACPLEEWERAIRTNLTGCFLCAKHSFPHLRQTRGSMVLIASTRAYQSEANTFAYSASKGGVIALAHSLAVSGGPEIRVNAIAPGWIHCGDPSGLSPEDHSQHPTGRVGTVEDIAGMTRYLVSDEAGFITGQTVIIDGGMTRKMIYAD